MFGTVQRMVRRSSIILVAAWLAVVCGVGVALASDGEAAAASAGVAATGAPWWVWPLLLLAVCFLLGVVSVLAGVGGGVLFVPIVGGFFPFGLDFVRGAALVMGVAGTLSAGPRLLRQGLADFRLAAPLALVASCSSMAGAMIGLLLPEDVANIALGVTILAIVVILLLTRNPEYPEVPEADALSQALRITGVYHEAATGRDIPWKVHRTPVGLLLFVAVGMIAGMFGLGAGWASTPVLNLVMGVPLKVAVSTSSFLISITGTSAAWVYINRGAVLPVLVVPSVIGVMLGARLGVRLLARAKPSSIRSVVAGLLLFSGVRALLKGLGVWN